jgi:hypothetical protein
MHSANAKEKKRKQGSAFHRSMANIETPLILANDRNFSEDNGRPFRNEGSSEGPTQKNGTSKPPVPGLFLGRRCRNPSDQ